MKAKTEERKTVVWWRHFHRHEELMTLEEFEALKRQWEYGECSIDTVDGVKALDPKTGWVWGSTP
jgi:hypothetical protein